MEMRFPYLDKGFNAFDLGTSFSLIWKQGQGILQKKDRDIFNVSLKNDERRVVCVANGYLRAIARQVHANKELHTSGPCMKPKKGVFFIIEIE